MDRCGGLHRAPQIVAIVAHRLIGSETNLDARIAERPEWHHAAPEPHVANRIMCDCRPRLPQNRYVIIIHPDRVDDLHALIQDTEIINVANERSPELLLAKHPLQLRFEDVAEERNIVVASQIR